MFSKFTVYIFYIICDLTLSFDIQLWTITANDLLDVNCDNTWEDNNNNKEVCYSEIHPLQFYNFPYNKELNLKNITMRRTITLVACRIYLTKLLGSNSFLRVTTLLKYVSSISNILVVNVINVLISTISSTETMRTEDLPNFPLQLYCIQEDWAFLLSGSLLFQLCFSAMK